MKEYLLSQFPALYCILECLYLSYMWAFMSRLISSSETHRPSLKGHNFLKSYFLIGQIFDPNTTDLMREIWNSVGGRDPVRRQLLGGDVKPRKLDSPDIKEPGASATL